MPQNEHVLRQWMDEQDNIARQRTYAEDKRRLGLATTLNRGLLSEQGGERRGQLDARMNAMYQAGPMAMDGQQTTNDIFAGPGIRPNYPTPDLKMHRGEVFPPASAVPSPIGLSEVGQLQIDEGFRSFMYQDKTNVDDITGRESVKTIGYGFNMEKDGAKGILKKAGITKSWDKLLSGEVGLTKAEARQLQTQESSMFRNMAKNFVGAKAWDEMGADRRDALYNMTSNLGNRINGFPSLKKALQDGDYSQAGYEVLHNSKGGTSNYAMQVGDRAVRIAGRFAGAPVHIGGATTGAGSINMRSSFPEQQPEPMMMMEPTMQMAQAPLQLGGPSGYMTTEGRRAYHSNRGGKSTEYSIGVKNKKINGGELTHIPSIYGGKILGQRAAEQMIIDNNGFDIETGRFVAPGGDPEARSQGLELIKQHARKPDAAYRQSQLPPSAPPNPYGNAGGGYADDEMARMVKLSQSLQNKPRGIMV
jgi:GH24 family phage-related lysozyme (muramidase)